MKNERKILVLLLCVMLVSAVADVPAAASTTVPVGRMANSTMTTLNTPTIDAGSRFSLAIKTDGSLWLWGGYNAGGGGMVGYLTPTKVMDGVISASSGDMYVLAVKTDGSLWAWGSNYYGTLGDGTSVARLSPIKIMDGVASVSAGFNHSLAVKTDGSLWAWGNNLYGQVGDGTRGISDTRDNMLDYNIRYTPIKIMDDVSISYAGYSFSYAIKTDGSLWAWGHNERGHLGDGTTIDRLFPVKVMDDVICVSSDSAVKKDGSLWVWSYSLPYDERLASAGTPVKIMDEAVYVSGQMAVKNDGSMWWFGYPNLTGGGWEIKKMMDEVISVSGNRLILKEDSSLWAWGHNYNGVIGDGTTNTWDENGDQIVDATKHSPVKVLDNVKMPYELPTKWARADVSRAVSLNLIPQNLQSKYTQATTRAEFCALAVALYEIITGEVITGRGEFDDTNDINVQKAAYINVVNGTSPGKFTPNAFLTREQAATMLARLAKAISKPFPIKEATFGDKGSISDWALEAVGQVQGAEIMNGISPTNFTPKGPYTREQSIITMLRTYNAMK